MLQRKPLRKGEPEAPERTRGESTYHVGDAELRDRGFTIHARPKEGPVLWRRGGRIYTQEEAERLRKIPTRAEGG